MGRHRYRPPRRASPAVRALLRLLYRGSRRHCVVCGSSVRKFRHYGHVRREDVQCPVCGCVERHRATWQFFRTRTNLFDGKPKRVLHVAPEPELERQLRAMPELEYVSLDPQDPRADVQMNLEALSFPDGHFDVVHCSHVLEHVGDDRAAMREIARVLAPGGWATILVPIIAEQSHEDPSVVDPKERARLYGQWDHVRAYGKDFPDRLREEGLEVEVVESRDLLPDPGLAEMYRFADDQVFFCRRAASTFPPSPS